MKWTLSGLAESTVKIPLFPTTTAQERFNLIRRLCQKRSLSIPQTDFASLKPSIPLLFTPGAAETLAVKIYRLVQHVQFQPRDVLHPCLTYYQNPVPLEIVESQIRLAVAESSDLEFVPLGFRSTKKGGMD